MDPDETLRQARKALADWEQALNAGAEFDAAERLSSAFGALDDFLSRGGHLPAAWQQGRTAAPGTTTAPPGSQAAPNAYRAAREARRGRRSR